MWYASLMPNVLPTHLLNQADAAVEHAQRVRRVHARQSRTDSAARQQDIALALERLHEAMVPLRSEIGRFPYGPKNEQAEVNRQILYDASQRIQKERRKLWKMKR